MTEAELKSELKAWKKIAQDQVALITKAEQRADRLHQRCLDLEDFRIRTERHYASAEAYRALLEEVKRLQAHVARLQGI